MNTFLGPCTILHVCYWKYVFFQFNIVWGRLSWGFQDECWFEPETKKHLSSSAPKKAKIISSTGNMITSVYWNAKGIMFIDSLQRSYIIKGKYYADFLRQLRKYIMIKCSGNLMKGFLFHRDNSPVHESLISVAPVLDCGFEMANHLLALLIWLHLTIICYSTWRNF